MTGGSLRTLISDRPPTSCRCRTDGAGLCGLPLDTGPGGTGTGARGLQSNCNRTDE